MKSLAWLWVFLVSSNVIGTFLLVGGELIYGHHPQNLTDRGSMILAFLGPDILFGGPILGVAAAAVVRHWLGRLTGFTIGVTAVFATILLGGVLAGGEGGLVIGAGFGSIKLIGAMLLAQVPFFRHKVLDTFPRSRAQGLSGTYAVSMDSGEGPTVALGLRSSNLRRRTIRRANRPERWESSFARLSAQPRTIEKGVKRTLFFGRSAVAAWASFPAGLLAAFGCCFIYCASELSRRSVPVRELAAIALALLALSLPRFGLLRLYERVRLLRLLREGEVVPATRSRDTLFDLQSAVITVAETQVGAVVVASPDPMESGEVQGLLVGKNGDVVAWDLLPFTPAVDGAGAITVA